MNNNSHQHADNLPPKGLDGLGVLLSSLCLVHCLATPVLASLLPLAAWFKDEHGFHLWLAAVLLPLGIVAFWRGYKRHSRISVVAAGLLGLSLLLVGILAHSDQPGASFPMPPMMFTVLGSLVLVFSHWKNWQYSRCLVCHTPKLETQPLTPGGPITCASANDPEHRHLQA